MIDLTKLIDLLPYYFKENDTYKDTQGKGILERFLEICGSYLEDQVVSNIEGLLDNLNVENCPEHFLGYFWEWFGCIPFAEGEFIDPDKWAQYYNGFDSKETYDEKKKNWTFDNPNNPIPLSMDQKRKILKYAISLLKCRGSRVFFETMFRLYGIDLVGIYDHAKDKVEDLKLDPLPSDVPITTPEMDDELILFDNSSCMDEQQNCMQCIPVYFYIRYTGDQLDRFKDAVTNFITKYTPFNARPIIKIVNESGSLISGENYYIRVTNLQTGEFQYYYTGHQTASKWDWVSSSNFQLFFRVDVWSDSDPTGENSTWFVHDSSEGTLDPNNIQQYPSGGIKVISRSSANNLEFNFFHYQAYMDTPQQILTVAIALTIEDTVVPGYSLDLQIWQNNQCIATNPTQAIDLLGKEVRAYAKEYPNSMDTSVSNLAPISVSPSVSYENKGTYYLLNITQQGQYRVSLLDMPTLYRTLNVLPSTVKFKLRTVDTEGSDMTDIEIPAGTNEKVTFYVLIEPVDTSIKDYSEVLGTEIQCINTGETYKVSRLTWGYGIQFTTAFGGLYKFRSLYNSDITDESLWATMEVTKLSSSNLAILVTPIETRELELNGTEGNDNRSLRTLRYQLEILYSSGLNFNWSDDPNQNGEILLQVYDSITDTTLSSDRKKWWGNDIDNPKTGLIHNLGNKKAYFDIEVPYTRKGDSEDPAKPYTGVVQIIYRLPLIPGISSQIRNTDPRTLLVKYTESMKPSDAYAAIIPTNPNDPGWNLDWSTLYPQDPNGPKQLTAEYQKSSETDTCKFTLELEGYYYASGYKYYDPKGNLVDTVEIEDMTNHQFSFSDPGKYVFELEGSDENITITVKDFVPTFKVVCNPTLALLDGSYSQVSTQVYLTIKPDKTSYTHQVEVFKQDSNGSFQPTGEILDCSRGSATYIATEIGVYKFQSVDAESELDPEDLDETVAIFNVTDKNGMIGSIVCEPDNAAINSDNPQASTVVRMYDKSGQEIQDSAFLIRFPDGTQNISGTTFTTTEVGTYTFSAVSNPSITGTFTVVDNTPKPQLGGVYIDPNKQSVLTWPLSDNIEIHFTAWDVHPIGTPDFTIPYLDELKPSQLTVQYRDKGSSGVFTSINYANPSGPHYNLYTDGGNAYHIIIQGLTLNTDTEIVIVPALNPLYRNGQDTYYLVQDIIKIQSVVLDEDTDTGHKYPGIKLESGRIFMSDGSTVSKQDWGKNYVPDRTKVYLDGKELTYVEAMKDMDEDKWSTWDNLEDRSMTIIVYATAATHTMYVKVKDEDGTEYTSNTITIHSERDYTDVVWLMISENGPVDEWNTFPSTTWVSRATEGSNLSKYFWLSGGYDGDEFSYEPNDEPYVFEGMTGETSDALECWDTGSSQTVSVGTQFTGIHKFRIQDFGESGTPSAIFRLVNYPDKTFTIRLKEMTYSFKKIKKVKFSFSYVNSTSENVSTRLTLFLKPTIYCGDNDGSQLSNTGSESYGDTSTGLEVNLTNPSTVAVTEEWELESDNIGFWDKDESTVVLELKQDGGFTDRILYQYMSGGHTQPEDTAKIDIENSTGTLQWTSGEDKYMYSNQSFTIDKGTKIITPIGTSYNELQQTMQIYINIYLRN